MKKVLIISTSVFLILLFSACTGSQVGFNPNSKTIHFVKGKPYKLPYNVKFKKYPLSPIQAVYLANNGMYNCRGGSVLWFSDSLGSQIPNSINGMSDFAIKMYPSGKAGCANPLSNQEYQYALNQQNQQNANARTSAQLQQQNMNQLTNSLNSVAANYREMTPKTYNVNMYHY